MPNSLPDWHTDVDALRDFAAIRLVVADIDGTLVAPTSGELSEVIHALRGSRVFAGQLSGVAFTIATGRTLAGVGGLLRDLRIPSGFPIVLYNGSIVIARGSSIPLRICTIKTPALVQLVDAVYDVGATLLAYCFTGAETQRNSLNLDTPETVYGWSQSERYEREINGMPVTWMPPEAALDMPSPSAILVHTQNGGPNEHLRSCIEEVNGITATTSGGPFFEVRPAGSTKASALSTVAAKLGLDRSQILAIGDNDNDADMIAWAGIGVAIATASPKARAAADFVSAYGMGGGAAQALRLVKHARKYFVEEYK